MKINYIKSINKPHGLVIISFFESDDKVEFEGIHPNIKLFSGKKETHYIIEKESTHYLFLGLGKSPDYKAIKTAFRRISSKQAFLFETAATVVFPPRFSDNFVEAAVSGLLLGTYKLGHYKKDTAAHPLTDSNFTLDIASENNLEEFVTKGIKIASAQLETYELVDFPSNKATPIYLSNWAVETGKKYGFSVEVFDREKSRAVGLHAFVAVGQGSAQEPQFIIMDYKPTNSKKHIGLVGKGITFDTGGLNIKTAGMVHMKCDMAGAGAVLGAMQLIADLKLPYRVTAIVPACENSVDAKAFLPSDVISSYHGSTIEIIDTDAEGRLILADGLSYLIKNFNPETVIDLATLTGSCVATFGSECCGLFTNNATIATKIQEAGNAIGERSWQLPLWDAYKSDIESEIADVKNYSGKPVAGAISAAKFLEYFTDYHPSWAHLDIAGVAFTDDEFAKTKHATAFGVHLITKFIENL